MLDWIIGGAILGGLYLFKKKEPERWNKIQEDYSKQRERVEKKVERMKQDQQKKRD